MKCQHIEKNCGNKILFPAKRPSGAGTGRPLLGKVSVQAASHFHRAARLAQKNPSGPTAGRISACPGFLLHFAGARGHDFSPLIDEAIAQFNAGENSVFYVKKEAANLLGAGVQFPEQLKAAASSNGIVRKLDSKINMSVKNVTESQQFKRWFGDWQNCAACSSIAKWHLWNSLLCGIIRLYLPVDTADYHDRL